MNDGRFRKQPKVVIVILNWNSARDTITCLDSLRDLSYRNREVVVVDNGSVDDSVAQISRAHVEVPVLETARNLGFSGGNNVGIRWAMERDADFVWLLNNDATVHPSALDHLVRVADSDSTLGAVGTVIHDMQEPWKIQAWGGARVTRFSGRALRYTRRPGPSRVDYLVAASILIRSRALHEIGLLDESYFMYWEDADLGFRLRAAGWHIDTADEAKVWHREAASQRGGSPKLDAMFSHSAVIFYRQHFWFPALPLFINVIVRSLRRLLRGDWKRVIAIWSGTWLALRGRPLELNGI